MNKFENLINRLPDEVIQNLKNTKQSPLWHPEGDAYIHTSLVFKEALNRYNDNDLLIAAIFHDLGKIDVHSEKELPDGTIKIQHIGHEFKSLNYIDKYFDLYSDITTNKDKVIEIVKNHMKAHLYKSGKIKKQHKRETFESLTYFNDIMKFLICDENGR